MQVPLKPYASLRKPGVLCPGPPPSCTIPANFKVRVLISLVTAVFLFPTLSAGQTYRVERVLDGDTVVLDNGERVRLIGADTTEKSHPLKPVEYFPNRRPLHGIWQNAHLLTPRS